jgi:hypothetical protein
MMKYWQKNKDLLDSLRICRAGVPNRRVATPWCVARYHEVCREIKKNC